jgi:cis-L-3-hydroxyproline dehydratase
MPDIRPLPAQTVLGGEAAGPIVATDEALSFWGGVDPATGLVIDVHHPLHGTSITGTILMMPTSRGSCTGSGVLLDLILSGRGPAALIFREPEDVLTLGAMIASVLFGAPLPVVRVDGPRFEALASRPHLKISADAIDAGDLRLPLAAAAAGALDLTEEDRRLLAGGSGRAAAHAMDVICRMAVQQGATRLIDVTRGHIDGCIYASPANLIFAEKMADLGGKVTIPTTMNAISVDWSNWRDQGVPESFGRPAARLADAYVRMGCQPTFTCSPYLLPDAPGAGEAIGWSESNAVIFANTVLAARTAKHPDFLDLCIALTGRAPLAGVYLDAHRKARRVIDFALPEAPDDSFWPLVGYLAGKASPDRIPLLRGLAGGHPCRDDLKALCAAFGTTSAAPMLHIEGVTPEAEGCLADDADHVAFSLDATAEAWRALNAGPEAVELVAIGSPHASLEECRALADSLDSRPKHADVEAIVTAGKAVIAAAAEEGILARLAASGIRVLPDLCWCSISEPVFPTQTKVVLTNSGKYAHYGPGLSGRTVRFGSLADCATAILTGRAAPRGPGWRAAPSSPSA